MLRRSPPAAAATCPRCDLPGVHGTADECIDALVVAVGAARRAFGPVRARPEPTEAPAAPIGPSRCQCGCGGVLPFRSGRQKRFSYLADHSPKARARLSPERHAALPPLDVAVP